MTDDFILVTKDLIDLINTVIDCAIKYEKFTKNKRKLGITGEIGEIFACSQFGLKLVLNSQSAGYDAIDQNGLKVQIKARKSESGQRLRDLTRLSRFSRHEFDYCLLLLFEGDYKIYEIWKAEYEKLLPIIDKEKNRNPSLGSFKKIAEKIFSK